MMDEDEDEDEDEDDNDNDNDDDNDDDNDNNDCLHHHILRVTASVEVAGYLACLAHCMVAPTHALSM